MSGTGRPTAPRFERSKRWRVVLAISTVAAALILRHDFWQWTEVRPLLFGVLPVGLWWQAGVSVLASVAMALLVRWAWPAHLETEAASDAPTAG